MKSCPNCRSRFDPTFTPYCPECGRSADPAVESMAVPRAQASGEIAPGLADGIGRPSGVVRFFRGIGIRAALVAVVLAISALWGAVDDRSEDASAFQVMDDAEAASTDRVGAGELAIGDCMMWPSEEDMFFSLERRPCDVAHDAEMYALVEYPAPDDAEYPGNDPITEWSVQACYQEFSPYVGQTYEDAGDLEFTFFTPTESGWRKYGDRGVQCLVFRTDESTILGSVRGGA